MDWQTKVLLKTIFTNNWYSLLNEFLSDTLIPRKEIEDFIVKEITILEEEIINIMKIHNYHICKFCNNKCKYVYMCECHKCDFHDDTYETNIIF